MEPRPPWTDLLHGDLLTRSCGVLTSRILNDLPKSNLLSRCQKVSAAAKGAG